MLSLGGNYNLSRLYGNFVGENAASGPLTSSVREYPEYRDLKWWSPKGRLDQDQRHKARLWLVWDAFNTKHHTLSVSLLESFCSGTPYGAAGTIALRNAQNQPYVTNPGYITPPSTTGYWFTARDKLTTENITRTDLSISYAFKIPALGTDLRFFLQSQVSNIFNEAGVEVVNATVYTGNDSGRGLTRFNPFTDKPVECQGGYNANNVWVCQGSGNWMKGPDFGKPTAPESYQSPRTFTVSLGVRFQLHSRVTIKLRFSERGFFCLAPRRAPGPTGQHSSCLAQAKKAMVGNLSDRLAISRCASAYLVPESKYRGTRRDHHQDGNQLILARRQFNYGTGHQPRRVF